MPVKEERNLILLDTQPMVSLPKGWAKFWKLEKGDKLLILYDSFFAVIPSTHPDKQKLEDKIREALIK